MAVIARRYSLEKALRDFDPIARLEPRVEARIFPELAQVENFRFTAADNSFFMEDGMTTVLLPGRAQSQQIIRSLRGKTERAKGIEPS